MVCKSVLIFEGSCNVYGVNFCVSDFSFTLNSWKIHCDKPLSVISSYYGNAFWFICDKYKYIVLVNDFFAPAPNRDHAL